MRGLFRNTLFWLIACVLLSFTVLAYPLYVIRPFRYQGQRELSVALAVVRIGPVVEIIFFIIALALLVWTWRAANGPLKKACAALLSLLVLGCGALSRVNVYEILFHPLDRPTFSPAQRATLDGREEVIALRVNGAARAYPVRIISYHHIVNDFLGGTPIVATY